MTLLDQTGLASVNQRASNSLRPVNLSSSCDCSSRVRNQKRNAFFLDFGGDSFVIRDCHSSILLVTFARQRRKRACSASLASYDRASTLAVHPTSAFASRTPVRRYYALWVLDALTLIINESSQVLCLARQLANSPASTQLSWCTAQPLTAHSKPWLASLRSVAAPLRHASVCLCNHAHFGGGGGSCCSCCCHYHCSF